MKKDWTYEQLREISWRRKLTAAEDKRLSELLAAQPELQNEWESEAALNEILAGMPEVPVASNFTARVLDSARQEAARVQVARKVRFRPLAWFVRWMPKVALAAVVVGAGLLSYEHHQVARRAELALSLSAVSQIPSVPSPEILKDFDAIAALGTTPPADEELLKLMQ